MTNEMKIAALYVALASDDTPTAEEMYPYFNQIEEFGIEVATANIIVDNPALGTVFFSEALTNEAKMNLLYDKVLGREPDAEGLAYWLDQLENNPAVNETTLAVRFLLGAEVNADQTDWENIQAYSATATAMLTTFVEENVTPEEVTGATYMLDEGRDTYAGTEDQDTFYAYVGQNQNGALSNALATGDVLDGGASTDTLIGSLINDETINNAADFAVMPVMNSVEEIRIQALENNVANDTVILDADKITAENHYASDSSRADLVITNVDITSTQITKDITLEMKDTQQNSDLAVYFDEDALVAAPDQATTTAQYFLKVGDGEADAATPIENVKIDITLNHNGNSAVMTGIVSTDGTYQGLADAITAALVAEGLSDKYSVVLGNSFSTIQTTNEIVDVADGFDILITSIEGVQFQTTDLTFSIGTVNSNVANLIASNANVYSVTTQTSNFVEADIILDNVGRSSNGGEVIVGSTSASDSSTGVEIINLEVRNSSVIHDVSTTNDDGRESWDGFQKLTITNGEGFEGDFVLTNANYVDSSNEIYNNVTDTLFKEGLEEIEVSDMTGDVVLGRDNAIVNLGTLDADSNVSGDVTYNAVIRDGALHTALTDSGDDTFNVELFNYSSIASSIAINTGNGTNAVNLDGNGTATITGGNGVDTIDGQDVVIDVQAGGANDVIYASNSGDKASFELDIDMDAATAAVADDQNGVDETIEDAVVNSGVEFLYNARLQVTLSFDGDLAEAFVDGYESEIITIEPATYNYITTTADVNNAIVEAINSNDVLNKLAVASIDGDIVVVNYLVDGVQAAGSIDVDYFAPATAWSPTLTAAIEDEFRDLFNDSDMTLDATAELTNALTNLGTTTSVYEIAPSTSTVPATSTTFQLDLAGLSLSDTDTFTITNNAPATYTYIADSIETTESVIADLVAAGTITIGARSYTVTNDGSSVITLTDTVAGTAGNVITSLTMAVNDVIDGVSDVPGGNASLTYDGIAFGPQSLGTDAGTVNNVDTAGSDSFVGGNVINGNAGDDVIVLTSGAGDTVEYTGYSQGHDTIVHFTSDSDNIDVSAYLTGEASYSGSTESIVDIAGTVATTLTFTANSANLVDFNDIDGWDAGETFANITAADVEAALEADTVANISEWADDNGENVLVGTTAKSVLIIHDDDISNEGEYKMFELTYNDADAIAGNTDFTVTLIGSFDLQDAELVAADDLIVG